MKKTYIGMLIGFLLSFSVLPVILFLPYPEIPENDEEKINEVLYYEENNMKIGQFTSVSDTNTDLQDLQSFANLVEYEGILYLGTGGANSVITQSADSILDLSTTDERETDETDLGENFTYINSVARVLNSKLYVAHMVSSDADEDGWLIVHEYDGTTWSTSTFNLDPIEPIFHNKANLRVYDILFSDAEIWYLVVLTNEFIGVGIYTLCFIEDSTGNGNLDLETTNQDHFYQGVEVGGVYYFLSPITALRSFDFGTKTGALEETLTLSAPINRNHEVQLYWRQGNTELVMDEDHFYVRVNEGDWTSFTDSGSTTNGVIWDYKTDGTLIIKYIIWKDSIYELVNGSPIRIQFDFTPNAYVGWEDWFANGANTIYQLAAGTIYNGEEVLFTKDGLSTRYAYPSLPNGTIKHTNNIFTENDGIIAYTEEDERDGIYQIGLSTLVAGIYTTPLTSPALKDWTTKLDASFNYIGTATDAPDIIADILAICQYLGVGTVSTTPNTTYQPNFHGTTVGDALIQLDAIENYRCRIDAYVNYHYDDGLTFNAQDFKLVNAGKPITGVGQWDASFTDWIFSNAVATIQHTLITEKEGSKEIMELDDQNVAAACDIYLQFTAQTTGIAYGRILSDDTTLVAHIILVGITTTNPVIQIRISSDKFQYYYAAAWHDATGGGVVDNVWYDWTIDFDTTTQTYDFYLGGVLLDADIPFSIWGGADTAINRLNFKTATTQSGYNVYHDAIGFSWDGYTAGDNRYAGGIYRKNYVTQIKQETLIGKPTNIHLIGKNESGSRVDTDSPLTTSTIANNWDIELPAFGSADLQTIGDALLTKLTQDIVRYTYMNYRKQFFMNQQQHFYSVDPAVAVALFTNEAIQNYHNRMIKTTITSHIYPILYRVQNSAVNASLIQQVASQPDFVFSEETAPADPAEDKAIMYVDGNGDLHIKINHGGTTKDITLVDWSVA